METERKKVILIVDDEADFIEMMSFLLENANFRVVKAQGPEEGLERAKAIPDLILLDLRMPGMSGHDVCRRLKDDTATQHIPVIMFTSHEETLDKVEAFNLGVVDYIGKHFQFEEILARIQAVLRESHRTGERFETADGRRRVMELRSIIDERKVRILFQPIVALASRKPIGYEALTRGPKGSFFESPLDLFGFASEANMFQELDQLCRVEASRKASFLMPKQFLSINVDPSSINYPHFKGLQFLSGSPVSAPQLCIEITERTCIKNFVQLREELSPLRALGMQVAIDDVGEGYASLKAIAELKPDFIKVDISLVRGIEKETTKFAIVQTIVELAQKLKSNLIAEGIETEAEYQVLRDLGVNYGQGYLFARPSEIIHASSS